VFVAHTVYQIQCYGYITRLSFDTEHARIKGQCPDAGSTGFDYISVGFTIFHAHYKHWILRTAAACARVSHLPPPLGPIGFAPRVYLTAQRRSEIVGPLHSLFRRLHDLTPHYFYSLACIIFLTNRHDRVCGLHSPSTRSNDDTLGRVPANTTTLANLLVCLL
jgi:hypothetical protein